MLLVEDGYSDSYIQVASLFNITYGHGYNIWIQLGELF